MKFLPKEDMVWIAEGGRAALPLGAAPLDAPVGI